MPWHDVRGLLVLVAAVCLVALPVYAARVGWRRRHDGAGRAMRGVGATLVALSVLPALLGWVSLARAQERWDAEALAAFLLADAWPIACGCCMAVAVQGIIPLTRAGEQRRRCDGFELAVLVVLGALGAAAVLPRYLIASGASWWALGLPSLWLLMYAFSGVEWLWCRPRRVGALLVVVALLAWQRLAG